jgi:NADPH2:quinone reductase
MPGVSRAWFVDRYGGPERLVLRERPDPVNGPGEVVVRTAAIGLNFADLFVRAGVYPRTPKPPFVPGMEISGVVEAVGESVLDLRPGQRVVAVPLFGGHAEKVAVQAAWVFPLPDGVDLVEAAAMPVAFLTAWYALARAEVGSGDRVVVTGRRRRRDRASPIDLAARRQGPRPRRLRIQVRPLPRTWRRGCRPLRLGGRALARHFHGRADAVMDAIGGRLFRSLWRRLDAGGRYVLYGFAAAAGPGGVVRMKAAAEFVAMGLLAPYRFVQSCRTLIGFNLSLLPTKTGELRRAAESLFDLWRSGRVRPILGPRFDFARLPEAHRSLASRSTTGKLLIEVSS